MDFKEIVQLWENELPKESKLYEELIALKEDEDALFEAFAQSLAFGTAGMRGVMGPGINRMNTHTVRLATYGLAQVIKHLGKEAMDKGVVIAYDSRHNSQTFAYEASRVLIAAGIRAYMFSSLRPTPELSFAVRHLGTAAGIMITASHNPPKYNGYKCYGEDGGQMPPEQANEVIRHMEAVDELFAIPVVTQEELLASDRFALIDEAVDEAYLAQVDHVPVNRSIIEEAKDLKIVYTPLHGTGQYLMEKVFERAGFQSIEYVPNQKEPDANFSTIQSPNPEDGEAFIEAEKIGMAHQADLLVATDPDADRMGCAIYTPSGYQVLTGNQIAAVLLDYLLNAKKERNELPTNGAVIKSIVSGELATQVAADYGVEMMNVLTGFKYIAEKIEQFEQSGSHQFLFGFEESYGYLVQSFVRDKDALQATVLLAEVAAYQASQGKTLLDALNDLYARYGFFLEKTISTMFEGAAGPDKMAALMQQFRDEPLTSIAGEAVAVSYDYLSQERHENGVVSAIDLPSSNVLKYHLENGDWFALRPSGTEPKMKCYIGVSATDKASAEQKIAAYETELTQYFK
ncbi:phospho-sugar mutase [Atopobacter phocae]|uniref:phospho-sugar mutase n=1 Tax=Atopobacter phocae TaxID=136492 RepID=UPI00046F4649|nr:phospho-sugar mutase [Atopobacter phocae]